MRYDRSVPQWYGKERLGDTEMANILRGNGSVFHRVVRSQRIFKGVRVGAIHDKGYLIMVRYDASLWTPIHVIRKLSKKGRG